MSPASHPRTCPVCRKPTLAHEGYTGALANYRCRFERCGYAFSAVPSMVLDEDTVAERFADYRSRRRSVGGRRNF